MASRNYGRTCLVSRWLAKGFDAGVSLRRQEIKILEENDHTYKVEVLPGWTIESGAIMGQVTIKDDEGLVCVRTNEHGDLEIFDKGHRPAGDA